MRKITFTALLSLVMVAVFAAAPTISSFTPLSAATGTTVVINGTNFTAVTQVSFGGTPAASFIVVSATRINAVVGPGTSGSVSVTNADGTDARVGFSYLPLSAIYTDFAGFWPSSTASPNPVVPNDSHNLLAFTYNGTTFSTGANNDLLTASNVPFTPGNFKALPVASITGTTTGNTSTYLALARKVDGSVTVANPSTVQGYSLRTVMTDGINGLNLGTGFTNLPTSAILTFRIFNISASKIADAEPDIILTQIAQPVAGNDIFSFVDASGNVVGKAVTQDMTLLQPFGSYDLDLFNMTPNSPYNTATLFNTGIANTNREIRLVGFKLSDFNLTVDSISRVRALRITPSGNSDYAFIAYNANALNIPPNISANDALTNTTICGGGTANLAVIAAAAGGGALTYSWEQSADGGNSWTAVSNGAGVEGATTTKLSVTNPANGTQYRATVAEAGNGNPSTTPAFTIVVSAPPAPTAVSVTGGGAVCLNAPVQLTSTVTGGSNLFYQWQSNASGSYADIPGANQNTYTPSVASTGAVSYRLLVSSGSGCAGAVASPTPATVTVSGIASVIPAERCQSGSVTLLARATAGTTVNWFANDTIRTALYADSVFTTPSLTATTTYYVTTSGCVNGLRVPVRATIDSATVGGTLSGSTTVNSGTNSTVLTLAGQTGSIVKWQSSVSNFGSDVTDIANTGNTYTAANLNASTQYRTVVKSGVCAATNSSVATITVQNGTLPVTFSTVKASQQTGGIVVQWLAENQRNIGYYEVEKSADGREFTPAARVSSREAVTGSVAYSWLDQQAFARDNYYRIRSVDRDGRQAYSVVVKVTRAGGAAALSLYPNPVSDRSVSLQFSNMAAGNYKVMVHSLSGQVLERKTLQHGGGNASQSLNLPGSMTNGIYRVVITGPDRQTTSLRLMIMNR